VCIKPQRNSLFWSLNDPDDIKSVEKIAERKGLSYTSLLRMWIKDYLAKEAKNVA
jgi:hypothetical protein